MHCYKISVFFVKALSIALSTGFDMKESRLQAARPTGPPSSHLAGLSEHTMSRLSTGYDPALRCSPPVGKEGKLGGILNSVGTLAHPYEEMQYGGEHVLIRTAPHWCVALTGKIYI
jgi:hypothetical protein